MAHLLASTLLLAAEEEGGSPLTRIVPGLMIWTLIVFAIVLAVLWRFAFGPIQRIVDERRKRIRQALEEADRARAEAARLMEEQRAQLAGARSRAEEILAEARRVAEAEHKRLREELEADRRRRLEETRREIEAETQRAIDQIRRQVAGLALVAAEKVTRKVLTEADQRRLVEEAVEELDLSALRREVV